MSNAIALSRKTNRNASGGLGRMVLWLCLGMTALMLSLAPPARAANRDRLEAFLNVTGFDVALESIKLSAEDGPAMLGLEASDFGVAWSFMADEVFDVARMQDMALDILAATLDDRVLTHAADFYASDLGQKLVTAENASHMADRAEKREDGSDRLARLMEDDGPRLEALQRLVTAVDTAEHSVRAMQEIELRFLLAARDAGLVELKLDEEGLRAAQAEQAEVLQEAAKLSAMTSSAHTYREFSDDELLTYAKALETPAMQELYELMNAVQYEIMANRFEALAARIADLQPGQEL
ncbi:DUF2059 domain-containing protein [Pseudooceanicola aestuarii]|uniref:DUF2059 domain-containing protein n=1 Tax=Pseudooceanicola aestuarii TaxID=2697319 RepID=UPI001EF8377D|nr:DUF2059 domain-containing protein [Pseudooceanicola aestuarii]